jgi:hypothetical protein
VLLHSFSTFNYYLIIANFLINVNILRYFNCRGITKREARNSTNVLSTNITSNNNNNANQQPTTSPVHLLFVFGPHLAVLLFGWLAAESEIEIPILTEIETQTQTQKTLTATCFQLACCCSDNFLFYTLYRYILYIYLFIYLFTFI